MSTPWTSKPDSGDGNDFINRDMRVLGLVILTPLFFVSLLITLMGGDYRIGGRSYAFDVSPGMRYKLSLVNIPVYILLCVFMAAYLDAGNSYSPSDPIVLVLFSVGFLGMLGIAASSRMGHLLEEFREGEEGLELDVKIKQALEARDARNGTRTAIERQGGHRNLLVDP